MFGFIAELIYQYNQPYRWYQAYELIRWDYLYFLRREGCRVEPRRPEQVFSSSDVSGARLRSVWSAAALSPCFAAVGVVALRTASVAEAVGRSVHPR